MWRCDIRALHVPKPGTRLKRGSSFTSRGSSPWKILSKRLRGPDEKSEKCVKSLDWIKWHWEMILLEYFSTVLSVSFYWSISVLFCQYHSIGILQYWSVSIILLEYFSTVLSVSFYWNTSVLFCQYHSTGIVQYCSVSIILLEYFSTVLSVSFHQWPTFIFPSAIVAAATKT